MLLAVLVIVLPVFGAARHTIITYKRNAPAACAGPGGNAWLDVLLLIPAAYGTYLLRGQGTVALPAALATVSEDAFGNPLLFLVPAFAMIAVALLLLRLMPILLRGLAWLLGPMPGVSLVLAARQRRYRVLRDPAPAAGPDAGPGDLYRLTRRNARPEPVDRVRYRVGSDLMIVEMEGTSPSAGFEQLAEAAQGQGGPAGTGAEYVRFDVQLCGARRCGRRDARRVIPGNRRFSSRNVTGQLIGVERVGFSRVTFWRRDFADQSLGADEHPRRVQR